MSNSEYNGIHKDCIIGTRSEIPFTTLMNILPCKKCGYIFSENLFCAKCQFSLCVKHAEIPMCKHKLTRIDEYEGFSENPLDSLVIRCRFSTEKDTCEFEHAYLGFEKVLKHEEKCMFGHWERQALKLYEENLGSDYDSNGSTSSNESLFDPLKPIWNKSEKSIFEVKLPENKLRSENSSNNKENSVPNSSQIKPLEKQAKAEKKVIKKEEKKAEPEPIKHHTIMKDSWICTICNYCNYPGKVVCQKCKSKKEKLGLVTGKLSQTQSECQDGWVCDVCYNYNYRDKLICNRCNQDKISSGYRVALIDENQIIHLY